MANRDSTAPPASFSALVLAPDVPAPYAPAVASAAIHAVDAPYFLVAHLTHPDHQIETVSAHCADRTDALVIARALRAAGWETTVRGWRTDQRIKSHTRTGKPIWGAGYVEVHG